MLRVLCIAFVLAGCHSAARQNSAQPVADPANAITAIVEGGVIAGVMEDEVVYFKGVPYAAPPVGNLRWREPQPVVPWKGVRPTQQFGCDCVQFVMPTDEAATGDAQNEDCLYLNVWAPQSAISGQRSPVLVWFHGGGFLNGGTSVPFLDGSSFAAEGVVVVTVNYRLGRLGFFAHPALTAEGRTTGNFGFLDQLAALQWVRKNIAALGGDPSRVTIAGHSAGGVSVIHLMTSRRAAGLFHRAVVLSGGGRSYLTEQRMQNRARGVLGSAEESGIEFARSAGIAGTGSASLAALRALPAKTVNGSLNLVALVTRPRTYAGGPIRDGVVVTEQPEHHIANGNVARLPVIIGTTGGDIPSQFMQEMHEPLASFGELADEARELYESREFMSPMRLASVVAADLNLHEPARFVARQLTRRGVPTWLYRFDYVANALYPQELRAPHASEIPFLFNQLDARYGRNTTDRDREVARSFHAYIVSFAKTGNPNTNGAPNWPTFNPSAYDVMMFGRDGSVRIKPDPLRERIALIESLYE
jgi:para-nitrobenzyl esterase